VLAPWWSRRALDPAETTGRLALLEAPQLEISATAIRAQLKQKHSPRYLLPDPVLDYILSEGLYR
jgi:nicotinate-nucleotide adenylyltransferase